MHGDGLLRATATRLDGQDALLWTPRGQQVAAPHLWVEWNPVDAAEVAERRPLEALARELAEGYVEHGREQGVRRLVERTWVHLLVAPDVPLGRVVVTAAFSEPQQLPVAAACASTAAPLAAARGAAVPELPPRSATPPVAAAPARPGPAPAALPPGRPAAPRRPWSAGAIAAMATVTVPARLRTMVVGTTRPRVPARAVLLVEDAAGSGLTDTDVEGRVELGRDPDGDVVVDHPGVSWHHLALAPDRSGGWTVTDLGSTNGTTVDGEPVTGPTRLAPGAQLGLGADGPRLRLQVPSARPRGRRPVRGPDDHDSPRRRVIMAPLVGDGRAREAGPRPGAAAPPRWAGAARRADRAADSVPWGETATIGRNAASDRHVHVADDQVSRVAAEIEIRDDAYLVINRQRHGGQLTLLVPGVAGQDRIREGNGLLVRDSRASLGLWLSDGREVTLALLAFGPVGGGAEAPDLAGGATVNAALPTDETWWSVLVAACGPTLIAAARSPDGSPADSLPARPSTSTATRTRSRRGTARPAGPSPSPKTQSEAFRHAQRWLRGVRLNDKTRGWRVAVVDQVIGLRLVTLDDVRRLFPAQVPADLPGRA